MNCFAEFYRYGGVRANVMSKDLSHTEKVAFKQQLTEFWAGQDGFMSFVNGDFGAPTKVATKGADGAEHFATNKADAKAIAAALTAGGSITEGDFKSLCVKIPLFGQKCKFDEGAYRMI